MTDQPHDNEARGSTLYKRLRAAVKYQYMPMRVRMLLDEAAEALSTPAPAQDGREAVARLMHVIDRDRYVVAIGLEAIRKAIGGHTWLLEGRGPYAWDDDDYRREFGDAIKNVELALEPLARIAADKSDCTTDSIKVEEARHAARQYLADLARSDSGRVEIPAGMVPWHGGDSAPADWDGGAVLLRNGERDNGQAGNDWRHTDLAFEDSDTDIIAYTPKPTASGGGEREAVQRENEEAEIADNAVNFVFDQLAAKLGLAEWRVVEGSEEWEGDVSATLHALLIDAGIIDDETGAVATLAQPATREDGEVERLRELLALNMVAVERLASLISAETPDDEHPSEADDRRYRAATPIFKQLGMETAGGADRYDPIGWGFDWSAYADLDDAERNARAVLSDSAKAGA